MANGFRARAPDGGTRFHPGRPKVREKMGRRDGLGSTPPILFGAQKPIDTRFLGWAGLFEGSRWKHVRPWSQISRGAGRAGRTQRDVPWWAHQRFPDPETLSNPGALAEAACQSAVTIGNALSGHHDLGLSPGGMEWQGAGLAHFERRFGKSLRRFSIVDANQPRLES